MTALDYVFRVLKIESKTRKILREEGVTDVDSLLEIEEELRNEGQLNLKAVQRKKLILYLDWSVSFEKEHRREPDPLNDFSADVYNDFKRERRTHKIDSQSTKENALILSMQNPGYYNLILTLLLSPQASMVKEDMLRIDEAYKNGFTSWFVGEIQSLMPSQLVDACSHFESKYIRFIEKFAERRFLTKEKESSSGEKSSFDPFLVGGRTQSGKTSFKAVCALTCNKMQLPLVIITKGVAESKELYAKLKDFLGDLAVSEYLVTPSRGQPRDYMKFTLHKFGVIVVADTAPQINRAADAVSEYLDSDPTKRFAVIVDECDDMYRTTGRTQKTEQAYDRLMAMDPIMKLMISATLVPLIVNMKNENESVGWFEFIEPLDDYASIEDMKVFTDADGKQVFLSGRELSLTSHEDIPYCNEKALSFYRYAVNSPGVKGTLVLDVTCPRVNAEGNIFDKAERIQHIHNQIIVVAIYGGGIRYKTDIDKEWERAEKGMCIGEVLEKLDVEYGLEWPIFVFGFSKMQRGMSFRSNQRVPSHILLSLGDGYSTEGMIQALGRATFNGKHILRTNGFQNVTVLTRYGHESSFHSKSWHSNLIIVIWSKEIETGMQQELISIFLST
jgi:hypothetical protein